MQDGQWNLEAGSSGHDRSVVVVGAGVVGASIAQRLARRGWRVTIVDQQRPGHVRAASGAPSRLLRCAAGRDSAMTASAWRARSLWKEIERQTGAQLYVETGCANIARSGFDTYHRDSEVVLTDQGVPFERLEPARAAALFPSMALQDNEWVLFEPHAGALLARTAVQTMVADACTNGARLIAGVARTAGASVEVNGERLTMDRVVYACGGWTKEIFPDLLSGETYRHDLFFFGAPATWASPPTPAWTDSARGYAGMGDIDGLGVRLGGRFEDHVADIDGGRWIADLQQETEVRQVLGARFPALVDAPVIGSAACHSTVIRSISLTPVTTVGGARLMRHPDHGHVWIVGDGSGSLFKHGPDIALQLEAHLD